MVGAWQAKTVGTESPYKQLRCKYDNKIILLNKIIKCIGIWLLWVSINMSWATDSLFKTEGRIIGILFQNLNQKISEIHYKQTTTVAKLSPAVSVVSAEIHRFLDGFPKLKIDSFFYKTLIPPVYGRWVCGPLYGRWVCVWVTMFGIEARMLLDSFCWGILVICWIGVLIRSLGGI